MFIKNKGTIISLVCIFAMSLGFIGIYSGHLESGRTLISTVITGFFGYSSQDDDYLNEVGFLLAIIAGAFIIYIIAPTEAFTEALALVMAAMGGYLGYLQQSNKET